MQSEEADIALANTLDTLASTGASAGGATALAQAALQSKKGVAASIQAQEASNNQLREQSRVEGERRIQNIQMSEAGRVQQAEVSGSLFKFGETDKREMQKLNRKSAQLTGAEQAEVAANVAGTQAIAAGISAVGSIGGAAAGNSNFGQG